MSRHIPAILSVAAAAWQLLPPAHGQEDALERAGDAGDAGGETAAVTEIETRDGRTREDSPFTFEVGGGVEYDSNVALLEIDTSTNVGDAMAVAELGVGYNLPSSGPFDLTAGYHFSESLHEDFRDFDVRLHRGSGTLSYDFGRVDAGVILQYAKAELDGADFMTLKLTSPYVSKLAGRRLFLRFAYTGTEKEFDRNALRAAAVDSWSSDIYIFLNGVKTYLLVGARRDNEDAIDPQFDYRGDRLRVQISHRFALGQRELTVKAGLRSETRDYLNPTPAIGALRNDRRVQLETSAELPIGERLVADFAYRRASNESNLPAVDFDEDVVSLKVTAAF